jgi:acyl-[acyl-carrier-protein]-phospholipid O-acyltransferase / long-chain-fatty-acid--[acyl-carrier-protein] ligase
MKSDQTTAVRGEPEATPRQPTGTTMTLPWRRSFWGLFWTQFQGAFSDNLYKFLVTFLIVGTGMTVETQDRMIPLVGALFALPFLLFSMTGGYLADRFSKGRVATWTKIGEVGIMSLALLGLWLGNLYFLVGLVFLMSTQSAIFGPTKYGLLPELLPESRLSWGNGVLGMGTFVSIIMGTVTAGLLSDLFQERQAWSGVVLVGLAGVGLLTSLRIDRRPAANPAKVFQPNFLADFWGQMRLIRGDRILLLAVLGSSYFWFLGALLQPTVLLYGKRLLLLNDTQSGLLQASLAIGIALGSLAAGYLSGRKIEYGLIPLGGLGISLFAAVLSSAVWSASAVAGLLVLLGFSAGFFIVPINAMIQHRPGRERKGSVLAATAFLAFTGVTLAAGVYYALAVWFRLDPRGILLVGSGLTLVGTVVVSTRIPDSLLRLFLWITTHTFYRMRVEGGHHIPVRGGALLVSNHLSLFDAMLVQASIDRPIRFLMVQERYDRWWLKPFARVMNVIPIPSRRRPREIVVALNTANAAIQAGELVCIFAEGQITRIGQMLPFRRGMERIMRGLEAPIIPVCLDRVWGSIFSFERGRFFWKVPRRIPHPASILHGEPMAPDSAPACVRRAIQELGVAAWAHRRDRMRTLPLAIVQTARRYPLRLAMADARVPGLRFGMALTKAIFLARRLRAGWADQRMVGILLPPSVGGVLVNWAALLLGKVPVNLNYTASKETIAACMKQCGIDAVLTSKAFVEKARDNPNVTIPDRLLFLEDLVQDPRAGERLTALALTWLLPARRLMRVLGCQTLPGLDDLATVIFSSGSTGEPKGVMLTHYNVMSNVEQLAQLFAFRPADRILGILPFFHSFGFTGTLAVPGALGVGVAYHPTPLDAPAIGDLVRRYEVTFLIATPTFLQLYLRGCEPEDFGSLRMVLTGAEKLPNRLALAFEEKFGIRPFEGYGCTECAPAVAVNTRNFRAAGLRQVGAKLGKIGHPLPGMSVRVVDPATMELRAMDEPGLLLVKGPNVMKGYLDRPDKTREVMHDGYYITGDIATEDEDGFLQITDRLSRFSKIGGEMVPHIRIEEKLHELAGATELTFVVAGLPDEKKGERLVVLHTLAPDRLPALLEKLKQSGLPNLWIPRASQFFAVPGFPMLGTGKLDLRQVREMAGTLAGTVERDGP